MTRSRLDPLLAVAACTLAACAPATPGAGVSPAARPLRAFVDSLMADARYQHAFLGVLVVDPERGDTLYSHNAGKAFMPASNQKLLTGAVALSQLGPDFRFSTTLLATGPVTSGVLQGDLRVSGMGDPSVSDAMAGDAMRPMRAMADSLAARGIRHITGQLVPGADAFPDASWGFGWSWDDTDFPYSAGVDELFFNEGFTEVVVRGGANAGEAPAVRTAPNVAYPRVRVVARTVAAGTPIPREHRVRVRFDSTDASLLVVEGTVAAGDTAALSVAYRDQPRAFLEALRQALRERGITVGGGIGPRPPAGALPEPQGLPLVSFMSPPLGEVLKAFEKPSQNQIGEILLKSLGRARTGVGSADSGARVVRDQVLAWGAPAAGVQVRDGSGLSRYNVVSPEAIIRVLDAMRRGPHAAAFRESLPVAAVDGTIRNRMRGTAAAGNVHAKTGTLNMVRSLSGYVTTADGRPLLFSFMANHFTIPTREIDALHEAIVVHLASSGRGR